MERISGVIAAAATPLTEKYTIDLDRLVDHCRWLLGEGGCDGVNLLGTTGEFASFSTAQRLEAMTAVAKADLPLERIMVGTGAAALEDTVTLTAAARALGFAGALLVPPFYYPIDEASLGAYVAHVIARLSPEDLRLYLYHIPQNTKVPYPVALVAELAARHPRVILGLKDSTGDAAYAAEVAARTPIDVFPSAEGMLAQARDKRFAGCISATTNVTGALARQGFRAQGTREGAEAIAAAVAIRAALARFPLMAAVKCVLAKLRNDHAWQRLQPPLRPLTPEEQDALWRHLEGTALGLRGAR